MPESRTHKSSLRPALAWLVIVLAWAAIYLPGLGTRELQGEEARRVLPGRTMIQTGDWIVPRSAGRIYNRKPPMVNWAAAAAIKITGSMDEWTVRMPSVLSILAMTLCLFGLGRAFLGTDGAFFAAIACLTNIGFIEKGRLIEIEALYISLFGIALMLWLHFWWREKPVAAWLTSMPVLGFGFLTKGPVHVWYFYAIVIAIILAEIRRARTPSSAGAQPAQNRSLLNHLLHWSHLAGLTLFLAAFLPWALANSARNPQKDSGAVWSEQITHRLGFSEFDFTSWLLQIPQSLVNFLPWALLLPLAWNKTIVAQWDALGRKGLWIRALRNGLTIGFLVIAVLPSSRPRFMLPLNVGGAMLLAMLCPIWVRHQRPLWPPRLSLVLQRIGQLVLMVTAIEICRQLVVGAISACHQPGEDGEGQSFLYDLASVVCDQSVRTSLFLILALLSFAAQWMLLRARFQSALKEYENGMPMNMAAGVAHFAGATMIAAGCFLFPALAKRSSHLRPFASEIRSHTGASPIVLFRNQERMWPFYLGLNCREIAFQKELPERASWVMTPRKDRDENLAILESRYGKPATETILAEPDTDDAGGNGTEYVLFGFAPRS